MSTALANGHAPAMELLVTLERAGACTPVALDLTEVAMTWERYVGILALLGSLHRRLAWYVGDALVYGEALYGEEMAQAAEVLGMSPRTLVNLRWVCSRVPPPRRRPELSFGHHDAVAALTPREQRRWLKDALDGGWTREQLRARLRDAEAVPRAGRVALGEAERNATERLTEALRAAVAAAEHSVRITSRGRRVSGWWVPDEAWSALVEAA